MKKSRKEALLVLLRGYRCAVQQGNSTAEDIYTEAILELVAPQKGGSV